MKAAPLGSRLRRRFAGIGLASDLLLLAHGADPNARTNVDDHATPLAEAEILRRTEAAALRKAIPG